MSRSRPATSGTIQLLNPSKINCIYAVTRQASLIPSRNSYFADDNDVKTMIQGVRLALRIARTKPIADKLVFKSNADEKNIFFMGDADPETVTDDQIEGWLRREVETIYHPVSNLLPFWVCVWALADSC